VLDLLTVPEASKRLRLGRSFTYELVQSGAIPAIRVGRRWLVPAANLDDWLRSQVRMPVRQADEAGLSSVAV
jgi:excisionase family DNA binding protein